MWINRILSIILLAAAVQVTLAEKKPLRNEDIIQMTKAEFDEETIVKAIEANDPAFDVSVDALIALKNEGVRQKVISAMLERASRQKAPATNQNQPPNESPPPAERRVLGDKDKPASNSHLPTIYVEEVSSEGSIMASSDTTLEAMKTLQQKGMNVVTHRDKAEYILQITRQLGKKSWRKDTKPVVSNREGKVVYANSTRSVGGGMGDVADHVRKHHE
ncbi:MAG: hypothetical protein L0387_12230 [Acidobacteria bacterium]|nr:hypothetical protein [Acidobacteriota bacterium]MCI0622407.1 hypothetical protein [Acidobacteriota bacterium]MCI0725104.1 hypothetical protein [Acidobacteriota bacterium]